MPLNLLIQFPWGIIHSPRVCLATLLICFMQTPFLLVPLILHWLHCSSFIFELGSRAAHQVLALVPEVYFTPVHLPLLCKTLTWPTLEYCSHTCVEASSNSLNGIHLNAIRLIDDHSLKSFLQSMARRRPVVSLSFFGQCLPRFLFFGACRISCSVCTLFPLFSHKQLVAVFRFQLLSVVPFLSMYIFSWGFKTVDNLPILESRFSKVVPSWMFSILQDVWGPFFALRNKGVRPLGIALTHSHWQARFLDW